MAVGVFLSAVATSPDEPDPDAVLRVLAAVSGMEYLRVLPAPSPEALSLLPRAVAVRFSVAPVSAVPDEFTMEPELCVAISDPFSFELIDGLRFSLRRELQFVLASPTEVQRIIAKFYPKLG